MEGQAEGQGSRGEEALLRHTPFAVGRPCLAGPMRPCSCRVGYKGAGVRVKQRRQVIPKQRARPPLHSSPWGGEMMDTKPPLSRLLIAGPQVQEGSPCIIQHSPA